MLRQDLARSAAMALTVVLLASAAPASAAVQRQYFGTTPQGYDVRMTGSAEGDPDRIEIGYRVRCRRHRFTHRGLLETSPPPFAQSRREFALVEAASITAPEDRTASVEVAVTGRRITRPRRPGTEYWQGTLEAEVEVRDEESGRLRERCMTRRLRWRAWREGHGTGRWTLASDPGEYTGEGRSYSLGLVVAFGDARGISVGGSRDPGARGFEWAADFRPPRGERLRRGATITAGAPEDTDSVGSSALEVRGPGGWCDYGGGEFTVDAIRFDRRGRLRALRLRFTHWCGRPDNPRLRGTIRFRSYP